MAYLRREVHCHLTFSDFRRLQQEAAAREVSVSKCAADCLREYFALRVDMASAVAAPRELGQPQQGLIHSILARTEERLAATLDAHADPTTELHRALQGVAAMLDRRTVLYTPELPDMKDGEPDRPSRCCPVQNLTD